MMSEDMVAVTKDGLRLSYGRFLADSAGGYVLLIIVGYIASKFAIPAGLANSANEAKSATIIFGGIFILLLGPPFGLALNSASWFLLGWIEVKFLNRWARSTRFNRGINWLTCSTGKEYSIAALEGTFRFLDPAADGSRDLYSQIHLLQKLMHIRFAAMMGRVEYLRFFVDLVAGEAHRESSRPSPIGTRSAAVLRGPASQLSFRGSAALNLPHAKNPARDREIYRPFLRGLPRRPEPALSTGCATERLVRAAAAVLARTDSRFLGPATSGVKGQGQCGRASE